MKRINIYKYSSYLTANTLRLDNNDQPVNAVYCETPYTVCVGRLQRFWALKHVVDIVTRGARVEADSRER
jgi:hypothetical protein